MGHEYVLSLPENHPSHSQKNEVIEVGNEAAPEADFGIRIHGDSMEPRYISEQIVWVQQTEELESGEIGIFYLDGNAYCKKLKEAVMDPSF